MYNYYDIRKSIGQNDLSQLEKIYEAQPSLFFEDYEEVFESALHSMAAYGNPEIRDTYRHWEKLQVIEISLQFSGFYLIMQK